MRRRLAMLFLAAPLAASASAQGTVCPISGISTLSYGAGCGYFDEPKLSLGFDTADCALELKITALQCCNTFITEHFLVYGLASPLPVAFELPAPPWFSGCFLYFIPIDAIGPFQGTSSKIKIPADPNFVGQSFELQAVPVYFTTIGMTIDFGITQAIHMTFL
jgi:hypothetical protein